METALLLQRSTSDSYKNLHSSWSCSPDDLGYRSEGANHHDGYRKIGCRKVGNSEGYYCLEGCQKHNVNDRFTPFEAHLDEFVSERGPERPYQGYRSDTSTTSVDEARATQRRLRKQRLSFNEVQERITLTWHNINVWAPPLKKSYRKNYESLDSQYHHRHILHNVSGYVHPGTLLAIMGASGAGKTTLMNVLTYRNRGRLLVEGDVRVNGGVIGRGMPAMSAYIQQDDLFIGTLKVKEHLWFQSQLRMDRNVPYEVRKQRVREVMQEMGLVKCQDVYIGIPGKLKGISGGEKKRLAFASEVLTNPPLMFCDEPTSGLDSFMARNIVKTLRRMAAKGRTILCTIHQPSSEVFELFDRVLLMAEGKVAYLGPAKQALHFIQTCGYPCPANYNPADHYVLTLAVKPGNEEKSRKRIQAICDKYGESAEAQDLGQALNDAYLQEEAMNCLMYKEDAFADLSPYKTTWFRQFIVVFWRSWLSAAREPGVFWTRLFQVIILALIFGLTYWQQTLDQKGVTNINGALFLMLSNMTFAFVFGVINAFPSEFPIFLREHMDGMYRVDVYFLSKTLAELPQFVVIPIIFTSIMYWMVGLTPTIMAFVVNVIVMLLTCNIAVSFGYVLSSSSSNVSFVLALGPVFVVPIMMIGGFYINVSTIPPYFLWLKYLSWFTYANEILIVNQWSGVANISCETSPVKAAASWRMSDVGDDGSDATLSKCLATGHDVINAYSYTEGSQLFNYGMLVVLFIGYRLIAFIMLAFRSRRNYKLPKNKRPSSSGHSNDSNDTNENVKLIFS